MADTVEIRYLKSTIYRQNAEIAKLKGLVSELNRQLAREMKKQFR